jgi:hypothetical protein
MNAIVDFCRKSWMPWICAKRLFGPKPAEEQGPEPAEEHGWLLALSLARTIIGFTISVMIYEHFRADDQLTNDGASNMEFTIFISIGLTLIITTIIAVHTKNFSQDTLQPFGHAGMALLAIGGVVILDPLRSNPNLLVSLTTSIIILWLGPFTCVSMVYWYLYPFGSSKKFPFLGPAITGATVVSVTLISLISGDGGPLPLLPWIVITLAGLSTSLALVAGEIHVLRRDIAKRAALIDETSKFRPTSNGERVRPRTQSNYSRPVRPRNQPEYTRPVRPRNQPEYRQPVRPRNQGEYSRGCLLAMLIFSIVVGGAIAIFILHATGVFNHYHMGCLSACQPPAYTPYTP